MEKFEPRIKAGFHPRAYRVCLGICGFTVVLLAMVILCGCQTKFYKPEGTTTELYVSPQGNFKIEERTKAPGGIREVWIVSLKNPGERRLLYSHERSIEVLLPENEKWLSINDYEASDRARVLLFQNLSETGFDFKKVEDITDRSWEFAAAKMGRKKNPDLDHQYVQVVRWTDDHTLLLSLYGHTDRNNFIEDWLFFYDLQTKTFSADLDAQNRRHTTLQPE